AAHGFHSSDYLCRVHLGVSRLQSRSLILRASPWTTLTKNVKRPTLTLGPSTQQTPKSLRSRRPSTSRPATKIRFTTENRGAPPTTSWCSQRACPTLSYRSR